MGDIDHRHIFGTVVGADYTQADRSVKTISMIAYFQHREFFMFNLDDFDSSCIPNLSTAQRTESVSVQASKRLRINILLLFKRLLSPDALSWHPDVPALRQLLLGFSNISMNLLGRPRFWDSKVGQVKHYPALKSLDGHCQSRSRERERERGRERVWEEE